MKCFINSKLMFSIIVYGGAEKKYGVEQHLLDLPLTETQPIDLIRIILDVNDKNQTSE